MSIRSKQSSSSREQSLLQNPYNIFYDNYLNTNATTECTGLGYRMPDNSEEWNAYREVFDFLPVPFPDSEDTKQQ